MTLYALVLALAIGVQAFARHGFGRRKPIGDESEYLRRASLADPHVPMPFIRVPVMAWFVRAGGAHNTEARVRDLLGIVALGTAAALAGAGHLLLGPSGAALAVAVFVLLPDRIVLSQHIWPDTLLGLWHAVLLLLIAWSTCVAPVSPWALGAVAAAAAMTRIDGVAVAIALTLMGPVLSDNWTSLLPGFWLPTVLALSVWALRNFRRYGVALPDTTFLFNLEVMVEEQVQSVHHDRGVDDFVLPVLGRWMQPDATEPAAELRSFVRVLRDAPMSLLGGIGRRIFQMLGPDTFSMQRLFSAQARVYPDLTEFQLRALRRILRFSFALLLGLAVAGIVLVPGIRIGMVPCAAAFLAACVVLARTRFRYALLPALALAAGAGLQALFAPDTFPAALAVAVACSSVALCMPWRPE